MRRLSLFLLTAVIALAAEKVEILRDQFGVPHIFASTPAGAAFGAGYAQAEDRADALIRNLAGAGAGADELSQPVRAIVEAYCAGINRYVDEHPVAGTVKITSPMVIGFSQRAFASIHGSNDVLIGADRTTTGAVITILDPLGSWSDDARPYAMRMYASGLAFSGVAPLGLPFPVIGHNSFLSIGWTGASAEAGPRALEQAWNMIAARGLAQVKQALAMGQIPGSALIGTAQGEIYDSGGGANRDYLARPRSIPQADAMVRQMLADPAKWTFPRALALAFSTDVYKAEIWQARMAKVAPEMAFTRMLTSWDRRSDATSVAALGFYLFKMALGPEAAAPEPPDSLSDGRIRAALRKAFDSLETEHPYAADYGTVFRVARDGSAHSYPVGGGAVTEAGMVTPRAIAFHQRGAVIMGGGGQSATQIVELSNPIRSQAILAPGESDRPGSPHFDDQARELFSKAQAASSYFGDRKELEKHLSAKKELIF